MCYLFCCAEKGKNNVYKIQGPRHRKYDCSDNLRENNLFTNVRQGKKGKWSKFSVQILEDEERVLLDH